MFAIEKMLYAAVVKYGSNLSYYAGSEFVTGGVSSLPMSVGRGHTFCIY
jgi:hypothetical protein